VGRRPASSGPHAAQRDARFCSRSARRARHPTPDIRHPTSDIDFPTPAGFRRAARAGPPPHYPAPTRRERRLAGTRDHPAPPRRDGPCGRSGGGRLEAVDDLGDARVDRVDGSGGRAAVDHRAVPGATSVYGLQSRRKGGQTFFFRGFEPSAFGGKRARRAGSTPPRIGRVRARAAAEWIAISGDCGGQSEIAVFGPVNRDLEPAGPSRRGFSRRGGAQSGGRRSIYRGARRRSRARKRATRCVSKYRTPGPPEVPEVPGRPGHARTAPDNPGQPRTRPGQRGGRGFWGVGGGGQRVGHGRGHA